MGSHRVRHDWSDLAAAAAASLCDAVNRGQPLWVKPDREGRQLVEINGEHPSCSVCWCWHKCKEPIDQATDFLDAVRKLHITPRSKKYFFLLPRFERS